MNNFGGWYTFPGGHVDIPGDTIENWSKTIPHNLTTCLTSISAYQLYVDESFEEVNFLLASPDKQVQTLDMRNKYINEFGSNFL